MALTEAEKGYLTRLIDEERRRLESTGPPDLFWLSEKLEAGELRAEALRLVQEAKAEKQAQVDVWPALAQARMAMLQNELLLLGNLEGKLSP